MVGRYGEEGMVEWVGRESEAAGRAEVVLVVLKCVGAYQVGKVEASSIKCTQFSHRMEWSTLAYSASAFLNPLQFLKTYDRMATSERQQ